MFQRAYTLLLTAALATCLTGLPAPSNAVATPLSSIAAQRARVDRSVRAYEQATDRLASVNTRIATASAKLDALVTTQNNAQARLRARAVAMYRHGPISFLAVITNAESFEGFSARWTILTRINRGDAEVIRELKRARKKVERSANSLLRLQQDAAAQVRAMEREEDKARAALAESRAEYADYQRRIAVLRSKAESRAKMPAAKAAPKSTPRGTGEWSTAVASHYGRNFTGRGADGERIGPTSMMVAHRTLPFGTLIEFRYDGRVAVARVADRGPTSKARTFDLGPGVVRVLDFNGVHEIQYRIIGG